MDIKEFKRFTQELSLYSGQEIEDFTFMTEQELLGYQYDLELFNGDSLSTMEHIRALFTFKKIIEELKEYIELLKSK